MRWARQQKRARRDQRAHRTHRRPVAKEAPFEKREAKGRLVVMKVSPLCLQRAAWGARAAAASVAAAAYVGAGVRSARADVRLPRRPLRRVGQHVQREPERVVVPRALRARRDRARVVVEILVRVAKCDPRAIARRIERRRVQRGVRGGAERLVGAR